MHAGEITGISSFMSQGDSRNDVPWGYVLCGRAMLVPSLSCTIVTLLPVTQGSSAAQSTSTDYKARTT